MKVELRRILIWLKGSNMDMEIRTMIADKTKSNYRVSWEGNANRMIPHDTIMKPIVGIDFNDVFLNIWCFNDQITEAEEILMEEGSRRMEQQKKLLLRQIENLDNFIDTLGSAKQDKK